ncbi:MAG: hypothetical protein ACREBS_08955 [Nitrososphaerales archaeon]
MKEEKMIAFSLESDEENQRVDLRAFRNGGKRLVFEGTIYVEELTVADDAASKQERVLRAEGLAREVMRAIIDEGM